MPVRQEAVERKVIAKVDIVFCLDASGSMTPCIEGVKDHIRQFVEGLKTNPSFTQIDWRLGIVAHDSDRFYVLDFTTDLTRFQEALTQITPGGDEFTLPALDWSLDFPWRERVHRVVILFTDEPLETGHDPSRQQSHFDELIQKIQDLRAMVYFVGPSCEEYEHIGKIARCYFEPIEEHEDFYQTDFQKVLERIGRTVSGSLTPQGQSVTKTIQHDLYGIKGEVDVIQL